MTKDIYDSIIIGGGPGGLSCAIYLLRNGFNVLLFEKSMIGGQMILTENIQNYPGFKSISGFDLAQNMKDQAIELGCIIKNEEVIDVELNNFFKSVKTKNYIYETRSVVIATGASERKLGINNESSYLNKGLSYCATCDGFFFKDKVVTIIGGGNSALADVDILNKIAKKINLIYRGPKLKANEIYLKKIKQFKNLTIYLNSKLIDIKLNEEKINGIEILNKETYKKEIIRTEGLFIAIGRVPNTELFKDKLQLDNNGYIIANENGQTNIDGVFAVGDVRNKTLRQIVTACGDGANASKCINDYLKSL